MSLAMASPNSAPTNVQSEWEEGFPEEISVTTAPMISFDTHSIPTGRNVLTKRIAMATTVSGGLVSHTILSSGRMLRSEPSRSRQSAGEPPRLATKMPTLSSGHSLPLFYQGLCYGRISFDGIATVKNFRD
jgi:hypothetical protein